MRSFRHDRVDRRRIGNDAVGRLEDADDVSGDDGCGLDCPELGVLHEDRHLDVAQLPTRLDAQVLDEGVARGLVRGQRVRLPTRTVERDHQLSPESLPVRVACDEGLELGDVDVAAEGELGIDAVLDRRDACLLEARHLADRESLACEVGERCLAPQRERLAEQHRGARDASLRCERAGDADHAIEAEEVDLFGVDGEDVSGGLGQQHRRLGAGTAVGFQRLAQVGHVHLQGRGRA